jgi:hypothetical protein
MYGRYKGAINGESANEIDTDGSGAYTYNTETGDVIICFEGCLNSIISGNKLNSQRLY